MMYQRPPSPAGCHLMFEPVELSHIIDRLRGTDFEFSLPLYQAALAGELQLIMLSPGGRVPVRLLDHAQRTTVVVVSGDPGIGKITPAPEAFPQARRLLAWAAGTMLHATGGKTEHYAAVVEAARLVRRVLLIETATAQEDAWLDLLRAEDDRRTPAGRHLPAMVISARVRGGVHPVSPVSAR